MVFLLYLCTSFFKISLPRITTFMPSTCLAIFPSVASTIGGGLTLICYRRKTEAQRKATYTSPSPRGIKTDKQSTLPADSEVSSFHAVHSFPGLRGARQRWARRTPSQTPRPRFPNGSAPGPGCRDRGGGLRASIPPGCARQGRRGGVRAPAPPRTSDLLQRSGLPELLQL